MNVPVTDCNDDVDNEDQDLAKDHPSTQLFVPVKTAPKKRKRKGDNTAEILTEAVNLLKTAVENDASKEMLAFLKEDIEISREHELKLFKLLCTQDGLQQPSFYPRAPSYNPYMSPSPNPFELVLCQDMPECMVEVPFRLFTNIVKVICTTFCHKRKGCVLQSICRLSWVEHRTGVADVTGSNPVEALIFFSGFFFPIA